MPKYIVTGQVFLADGFEWKIEAPNVASAEARAKAQAESASWPGATLQEVCINSTELVEGTEPVKRVHTAIDSVTCHKDVVPHVAVYDTDTHETLIKFMITSDVTVELAELLAQTFINNYHQEAPHGE